MLYISILIFFSLFFHHVTFLFASGSKLGKIVSLQVSDCEGDECDLVKGKTYSVTLVFDSSKCFICIVHWVITFEY